MTRTLAGKTLTLGYQCPDEFLVLRFLRHPGTLWRGGAGVVGTGEIRFPGRDGDR